MSNNNYNTSQKTNYSDIDLYDVFSTESRSLCDVFYDVDIFAPEGSTFYDNYVEEIWGDPFHSESW